VRPGSVVALLGAALLFAVIGAVSVAQQPPQAPACATFTVNGNPICNTAVVLTRALDVQNVDHFCKPQAATVSFVCSTPTPAAWCPANALGYPAGTWVDLVATAGANATNPGASINVNNCGLASIKLRDGVTDPGTALVSGSYYHLVSDGTVFRIE